VQSYVRLEFDKSCITNVFSGKVIFSSSIRFLSCILVHDKKRVYPTTVYFCVARHQKAHQRIKKLRSVGFYNLKLVIRFIFILKPLDSIKFWSIFQASNTATEKAKSNTLLWFLYQKMLPPFGFYKQR